MRKTSVTEEMNRAAALKALVERAPGITLPQCAVSIGISINTLERYLADPTFREQLRNITDATLCSAVSVIDKQMVRDALDQNNTPAARVAAAKVVYQRLGALENVVVDKTLQDFLKKLDTSDRDELEFFQKHGRLPDEAAATLMDEPDREQ